MTAVRLSGSFQRVTQVKSPFSAPSMGTLLVMIGAWFMLNAFLVVAAINDKLQSWVRYLLCTPHVGHGPSSLLRDTGHDTANDPLRPRPPGGPLVHYFGSPYRSSFSQTC